MDHLTRMILPLLVIGLLGGCIEVEETYVLNPDGSGKVHRTVHLPPMIMGMGKSPEHPDELVRELVRREIKKSEGVDAWKDVSYSVREDGWVTLNATAYFSDLNALSFHNNNLSFDILERTYSQSGNRYTLRIGKQDENKRENTGSNPDLTDEELDRKVQMEMAGFRLMRPVFEPWEKLRINQTYQLPGPPTSIQHLQTKSNTSVSMEYSGREIMDALDELLSSEEQIKQALRSGKKLASLQLDKNTVLGERLKRMNKDKTVTGKLGEPQFEYTTQMRAAHSSSSDVLKKIGVSDSGSEDTDSSTAPGNEPGDIAAGADPGAVSLENLRLSEVKMRLVESNFRDPGMRLSFLGELSAPVLNVENITIHDVKTGSGSSLMLGDKELSLVHQTLNDTGDELDFSVDVKLPDQDIHRLSSLDGTLEYTRSTGTKPTELDIDNLQEGAETNTLGAHISNFNSSKHGSELKIELDLEPPLLKEVVLRDSGGNQIDLEQHGWSSSGGKTTFHYESDNELPENATITVKHHVPSKSYELPIQAQDMSLFSPDTD